MTTQKNSKKILSTLLSLQGVTAASVIGRDGFIIESESNTDVDLDALGAIVSTGFGASEVMAAELNLGKIQQTMVECDSGKIIMADCGDTILAVTTDKEAIIGSVRHHISKVIASLIEAI